MIEGCKFHRADITVFVYDEKIIIIKSKKENQNIENGLKRIGWLKRRNTSAINGNPSNANVRENNKRLGMM